MEPLSLNQNDAVNKNFQSHQSQSRLVWIVFIILLLLGSSFFANKYVSLQKELVQARMIIETQKINTKVLYFNKLFIEKILKAESEVDFKTRLDLENAVQDIGDEEITIEWQKFVESKSEKEAQEEAKQLLGMLADKIKIQ